MGCFCCSCCLWPAEAGLCLRTEVQRSIPGWQCAQKSVFANPALFSSLSIQLWPLEAASWESRTSHRRPSCWRGQRAGIMVCISSPPGCRLAVAFPVEVQSSPTAIASALAKLPLCSGSWPCPFGHRDGPSGTILCWLPSNLPSCVTVASSSSPPGSLWEWAILVVVWGIQVRGVPMWRSQGLGCSEALSQATVCPWASGFSFLVSVSSSVKWGWLWGHCSAKTCHDSAFTSGVVGGALEGN